MALLPTKLEKRLSSAAAFAKVVQGAAAHFGLPAPQVGPPRPVQGWLDEQSGQVRVGFFHYLYGLMRDAADDVPFPDSDLDLVEQWIWDSLPRCARIEHADCLTKWAGSAAPSAGGGSYDDEVLELVGTYLLFRIELMNAYLDQRRARLELGTIDGLPAPVPLFGRFVPPEDGGSAEQRARDARWHVCATQPGIRLDQELFEKRWREDAVFRARLRGLVTQAKSERPGAEKVTVYFIVDQRKVGDAILEALGDLRSLVRINVLPQDREGLPSTEPSEFNLVELLRWMADRNKEPRR